MSSLTNQSNLDWLVEIQGSVDAESYRNGLGARSGGPL
ncbi:uncharacterized protein METZ01_LOCUS31110, partial [marine metagenome]